MTKLKLHALAALALAILFGVYIADQNGISYLVFVPNFIGLIIGSFLIGFSDRFRSFIENNFQNLAFVFAGLMLLTLFGSGIDGVRRWIPVGPLQLNVSMALAPLLVFASLSLDKNLLLALLTAVSAIYILQPDAGQATAFALATSIILVFRKNLSISIKLFGALIVIGGAVCTWFRADPLPPVRQVEEILHLAVSINTYSTLMTVVLVLFLFSPLIFVFVKSNDNQTILLTGSFFVYWVITFAVTELGHFPVPVIGAGAAGVLGWSLTFLFLASNLSIEI